MVLKIGDDDDDIGNINNNDVQQPQTSVGSQFLSQHNIHPTTATTAIIPTSHDIEVEYHRLARGLKLCYKYSDALTRLHTRLDNDYECTLTELIEDDTWYYSPEYEFDSTSSLDKASYSSMRTIFTAQGAF